jgi:hypothetical protein
MGKCQPFHVSICFTEPLNTYAQHPAHPQYPITPSFSIALMRTRVRQTPHQYTQHLILLTIRQRIYVKRPFVFYPLTIPPPLPLSSLLSNKDFIIDIHR